MQNTCMLMFWLLTVYGLIVVPVISLKFAFCWQSLPHFGQYLKQRERIAAEQKSTDDMLDKKYHPEPQRPTRQPIRPVPSVKVCCHCSRMPYSYKYCAANPLSIKLQADFCVRSFTSYFVHFLSNFNAFIYTKVILVRVTFHNRLQFFDRFPS